MASNVIAQRASEIAKQAQDLSEQANEMAMSNDTVVSIVEYSSTAPEQGFFITGLTVFVLACFVGYYVVWKVTPALHSPLMSVTNAISSVVIVGALIAAGPELFGASKFFGYMAIILASVNIFGGFLVTRRMLEMFKKKAK